MFNATSLRLAAWAVLLVALVALGFKVFHADEDSSIAVAPQSTQPQELVLALTWHPAHCEIRPNSADCRGGTDGIAQTQFSLHGLWPQPYGNFYCGVPDHIIELDKSGAWNRLAPLELSPGLRRDLERQMPGTRSFLHRHEWIKHGTCYGADPETYFRQSLNLMGVINASTVRTEFVGATGAHLSAKTIRTGFDEAFGSGAGARVRLACANDNGRKLITELRVHFSAAPASYSQPFEFGNWMRAAPPVKADCSGGIVDAPEPN